MSRPPAVIRPPVARPPAVPGSASTGPGAPGAGARPRSRPPVTLEDRSAAPVVTTGTVDGAAPWVSGLLAGLQAALLSFLVIVVPTVVAYVATSGDPANADLGWGQAVATGAAAWLLGHGAVLTVSGATVSIVPLGISALALFVAFASARRTARPTVGAWGAGVGGYVVALGVATVIAGPAGPLGGPGWGWARLVLGGGALAAVGLGLGGLPPARRRSLSPLRRLPEPVRRGLRAGAIVVAAAVAVAALVTTSWVLTGRATAGDVVVALDLTALDGVLLAVGQLALAPNLVGWALAWLTGPGFAVGAGTSFAPDAVIAGPLPALPLLGVLPPPGRTAAWVPAVLVVLGIAAGWWLHRRARSEGGWARLAALAVATLTAGLGVGFATLLAGGSAGPGRMAVVGGDPLVVGGVAAALVGVGLLLTLPLNAGVRGVARRAGRAVWSARPSPVPATEGASGVPSAAVSATAPTATAGPVREVPEDPEGPEDA